MKKTKRTRSVPVLVTMLLCAGTTAGSATTTVNNFPSWWKTMGAPDGVTRTQGHFFHSDPNTLPSPDFVYDGFTPSVPDNWNTTIVTQFDVDRPGGISPFVDSSGLRHGDGVAKGGLISTNGGQMSKLMGNLADPDLIKLFHVEIVWWGGMSANDVTLGVQAAGDILITQSSVITDGDDPNWHLTSIDGIITPKPASETFTFDFAAVQPGSEIFVDAVYIGTHCIPEPASLALLALGSLVGLRRRRR